MPIKPPAELKLLTDFFGKAGLHNRHSIRQRPRSWLHRYIQRERSGDHRG